MKTKLCVEIHKSGSLNDEILKMIANHNEGKVKVDLQLIKGFIRAKYAIYPTVYSDIRFEENVGLHSMEIYENEKLSLTISEKEIDLTSAEADLLTQQYLS